MKLSLLARLIGMSFIGSPAMAKVGGRVLRPKPLKQLEQLNVVGQLSREDIVGTSSESATQLADVWAYGNFAYVGSYQDDGACSLDYTGVQIVNITDPTAPNKVAFIPAKPSTNNLDVKVAHIETEQFHGEILVAANQPCDAPFMPRLKSNGRASPTGQGGVAIWDVSDPTNPKVLKQNFAKYGVHNSFIWQQGSKAYMMLVDYDGNEQDVHIVDITNPSSPKEIATTGRQDWPEDIAEEFGECASVFFHDGWVQEDNDRVVAYLAYWDAGLILLDISDPSNPVFLGDSTYAIEDPLTGKKSLGAGHVAVPNADGTRVLLGDEIFQPSVPTFKFAGDEYCATEGAETFTKQTSELTGRSFEGAVHWTGGEGCTQNEFNRAANADGEIALIQRGTCFFQDKAENALALGYSGFIVANDEERGNEVIEMVENDNNVDIPGYFVGHDTGEIMKEADEGTRVEAVTVFAGYGYCRLLNVEDPEDIVEIAQFALPNALQDGLTGTHTMHNVVVDDGTTAYISWYNEGMSVVDFGNDKFTQVAHFVDDVNGSNFWGVYLHEHPNGKKYILGSDMDTGLWIFEDVVM